MTRFQAIIPAILLLLAAAGCAPPPLCSTGDGCHDIAADDDGVPPPDLPCGGADLLTDDANCGACGNVCELTWSESTPYSSGHCVEGKCGPHYVQCGYISEGETCSEVCQSNGNHTCVARGCAGVQNEWVTGLIYNNSEWEECLPDPPDDEFTQDCDEPIPWNPDYIYSYVHCCCL